ncbi:hypothetical protein [Streptomyces sp. WMMB303]|uniref:hypothetical protein n=1 Tax=Streptomyces sp. WMMB303 TaxID=3034154 RepID=UPI0023EC8234|nr:hypothetical protein [Streptomyces sp. WMMB303]MDF4251411.1 hypothetical protein [Streptomyces sp. WMMB303]
MTDEFHHFTRTYLQLEIAYDDMAATRETLQHCNPKWTASVKEGFKAELEERSLTVDEYEGMTDIEFPDKESLYAYLSDVYAFLFEGGSESPLPHDA